MSTPARFWTHVARGGPDECWFWTGARGGSLGYGYFGSSSERLAHRYAWAIEHGPVPDGMQVLHRCDNPPCVNARHLFLGTDAVNVEDKVSKGRQAKKLTDHQVREIRLLVEQSGESYRAIGRRFGVSGTTIMYIRRGTYRRAA